MHNIKLKTRHEYKPTLIASNPDEFTQGLRHYQYAVSLDKCNGSCNKVEMIHKIKILRYASRNTSAPKTELSMPKR